MAECLKINHLAIAPTTSGAARLLAIANSAGPGTAQATESMVFFLLARANSRAMH